MLVQFAVNGRVRGAVVEGIADQGLAEAPLFLHHHHYLQAGREFRQPFGFNGGDHAQLVNANPRLLEFLFPEAQQFQGLHHVNEALAGRNQPDPVAAAADDDPVQLVGADVSPGGQHPLIVDLPLELHREGRNERDPLVFFERFAADFQLGNAGLRQLGKYLDDAPAIGHVGDDFQRAPQAAEPGHGNSVEPVFQHLPRVGREQGGKAHVVKGHHAVAGDGGAFAGRVVPAQRNGGAVLAGPDVVGMAEGVPRAVNPRALAVPHPHDPIEFLAGEGIEQLGAVDGRCRHVLVDARLEDDVPLAQHPARRP